MTGGRHRRAVWFTGLALAGCGQAPAWQADATVIFADTGLLLGDRYVRPVGTEPAEGSILDDLRVCGVTRFEVFGHAGWQIDTEFHVVAPRDEVAASLPCLRRRLPAGLRLERYDPTRWPEGRR